MKELTFITTQPDEDARDQHLRVSKIRSYNASRQHIRRRQKKLQFQSSNSSSSSDNESQDSNSAIPIILTVPTGSYISMPFLPGSLNLNLYMPTTRDIAIVEQVGAWQWYTTRPYFSRISYIFNLETNARSAHQPPKPFDPNDTFAVYLCKQRCTERSFFIDAPASPDTLSVKSLALSRMHKRSKGIVDTMELLTDVMHMAMLEAMEDIESSVTQVHLNFVKRELLKRKTPKTPFESMLWRQSAYMIGDTRLTPEWPTHYRPEGIYDKELPVGFSKLSTRLSARTIANIKRANQILCGKQPVSTEEIEALPTSEQSFPDIFHAIDSYRISDVRTPKLPQLIDLAILVIAAEDSTGRALTGTYDMARIHLARAVENFKPIDRFEQEFWTWAWMISITSWRNIDTELTSRGLELLNRLWITIPKSKSWITAEGIAQKFLLTRGIALRLRKDWQIYK